VAMVGSGDETADGETGGSSAGASELSAVPTARFVVETGVGATIANLIEPTIVDLGYRLVRIKLGGADKAEGMILQVMCERADGTMAISDCETVSRQLSPLLDANEPIPGAYRLEVSSPGIDRPLVRPSDFEDWAGYEAKLELTEPVNGRKRFRGIVDGYDAGEVRLACDLADLGRQVLGFPTALVAEARLVLTDDLIRETLQRNKKSLAADPDFKGAKPKRGKRKAKTEPTLLPGEATDLAPGLITEAKD
jgi:ribosome maturation factor RimP